MEQRIDIEQFGKPIIIFAVGKNDSSISKIRIPIENYKTNIKNLISQASQFTEKKKIVFLGLALAEETKTNPVAWDKNISYTNENIEKYDLALKEVCAEEQVKYLPLRIIIGQNDLADGLHPNAKGHEKIFKAVRNFLSENKMI
jgi:lysophospholipase L1-like esterase